MLFMLNLFSYFFLIMVIDAFLIFNAVMHWLCFYPIALYGEIQIHFMAFWKLTIGLKYFQNLNILPMAMKLLLN